MQNINLERRLLSQEASCSNFSNLHTSNCNPRKCRQQHCTPYPDASRSYILSRQRNKRRKISSTTKAIYADELSLPYLVSLLPTWHLKMCGQFYKPCRIELDHDMLFNPRDRALLVQDQEYTALGNEAYWSLRPVTVLKRTLQIGTNALCVVPFRGKASIVAAKNSSCYAPANCWCAPLQGLHFQDGS